MIEAGWSRVRCDKTRSGLVQQTSNTRNENWFWKSLIVRTNREWRLNFTDQQVSLVSDGFSRFHLTAYYIIYKNITFYSCLLLIDSHPSILIPACAVAFLVFARHTQGFSRSTQWENRSWGTCIFSLKYVSANALRSNAFGYHWTDKYVWQYTFK